MDNYYNEFDGTTYTDPRAEVRARAIRAQNVGDSFVAIPVNLAIMATVTLQQCSAKTVVNGNRMAKTLIEIRCEKMLDPTTGKHKGMHTNGRDVW